MSSQNASGLDVALWSDDPADIDLLAFDAVAATVAEILLDKNLDPIALGLSGAWGSGKTTVLGLVAAALRDASSGGKKVLIIETDPWRYDPATGAKESLIGEVLSAVAKEVEASTAEPSAKERAKRLAGRLAARVDWAKALKLTAKASLAFQIPSVDQILDLVKPPESNGGDEETAPRGLDAFRDEFDELISSEALEHIHAVAVLVDDLDRCLPPTVVETLEAIRLFLSVPRMSFVIAADEERVADALRERFPEPEGTATDGEEREEPATLYLHKIVQTTIPVPALSRFDTQAFLLLLQLQQSLEPEQLGGLIDECGRIRREGGGLDDIKAPDGIDLAEEAAFAGRLTPILYEKLRGNPRRIKRFLNDLRVRQSIADRRGIALRAPIVAKLMVLEKLLPREFESLLDWLAQGTLRDQLSGLEAAAGQPAAAQASDGDEAMPGAAEAASDATATDSRKGRRAGQGEAKVTRLRAEAAPDGGFSEGMLRWAKLPPALADEDLSPYLYLAAAFAGRALIDEALPERLRDLAANLLSRRDQSAVSDDDLRALPADEAGMLLGHLGRTVRDQPDKQLIGISSILRLVKAQPDRADEAADALRMIPADELKPGTALLFKDAMAPIRKVLERWRITATREAVKSALAVALAEHKA